MADTRVVHEDVHVAEMAPRRPCERLHARRVGDVARDVPCLPAAGAELRRDRRPCARGYHDRRAGPDERTGHRHPDAPPPARAGDHGTPSGERHGASSARTASARIAPRTSIVRAPSSTPASAGEPKYARGPPAASKLVCPDRMAPLSERGLAGSDRRIASRTSSGRAAITMELSY